MKRQLLLFLFYIIHCAILLLVLQSIIEYQKRKMQEINQNKNENLQNRRKRRKEQKT